MKQKDIAIIVMCVGVSALLSFFITSQLFGSKVGRQKVETVQVITTEFQLPDKAYFNEQSLNPTKLITIEQSNNQNPFSGDQ